MLNINKISKQVLIYIIGLFLLAIGITFSVNANLGVSPVASLGYTFALISPMSLGVATFVSNIVFIMIQFVLTRKFKLKSYIIQLIIAFIVSSFLDLAVTFMQVLPMANVLWLKILYLIVSLFVIAFAVTLYLLSGLPMMPYDTMVPIISEKFNLKFSSAKMICDVSTVIISLIICFILLGSWGSIGIGTIIAALFIGKILGLFMKYIREPLLEWFNAGQNKVVEQ